MRCFLPAIALGCAGTPDSGSSQPTSKSGTAPPWTDPAADDDWSHLIDPVPESPPPTPQAVSEALQAALNLGIPTMGVLLSRYRELYAQGDAACPGSAFAGGFEVFGSCVAESGVEFSGVAGIDETDGRVYEGDAWVSGRYEVRTSPADYTITRTDGTQLQAGGFYMFFRETMGGRSMWSTTLEGSWSDSAAEGWLYEGISMTLTVQGQVETTGESGIRLDGSYTVGGTSLSFTDLRASSGSCDHGGVEGSVTVRLAGGELATVFLERCTHCGPTTLTDGSDLGEVCIDPTPLLSAIDASGWIP
jgi:hypothetical protein